MIAVITTSQFLGVQIAVRSTDRRSLTVRSAASPRISASAAQSAAHPRTAGNALAASISLYDVLGVPVGATCQEIKAAYRRLARACHPDVAAGSTDEFMRVNAAYSTLSDPVKRADYDRGLIVASGSPRRDSITDDANRRRTFAKRKKGLLKKVSELSVLCGVPACALVAAPGEPNHDIWPSIVGADALISQLKSLPPPDQDKRSLDQEKYLAQTVSRLKEQLRKIEKENQEAEAKAKLFRCLCGNDDDARGAGADAREVCALVEGKARAVKERINGCPPAVAEAALQPPAVEEEEEMKNMWGGVGDVYDSSSSSNNGFYFTCNFNNYGSYNNLGSLIFPSGPSF